MSSLLVIALLVVGCGGGAKSSGGPGGGAKGPAAAGTYEVKPLPGVQKCWMGDGLTELASGQSFPFTFLYRRSWDAASSTIYNDAVSLGKDAEPQRSLSEEKVTGQTSVVSGANPGTAELVGEAGSWTAWNTTLGMPAGEKTFAMKGTYTISPENVMAVQVSIFDDTNAEYIRFSATLNPLDDAACNTEFSKIAPAKAQ